VWVTLPSGSAASTPSLPPWSVLLRSGHGEAKKGEVASSFSTETRSLEDDLLTVYGLEDVLRQDVSRVRRRRRSTARFRLDPNYFVSSNMSSDGDGIITTVVGKNIASSLRLLF
jgi:hypothetical protein